MDPAELLRAAEALIKEGDIEAAKELLDAYLEWRITGGFEPRGGDAKMSRLNKRVEGGAAPRVRRKPAKKIPVGTRVKMAEYFVGGAGDIGFTAEPVDADGMVMVNWDWGTPHKTAVEDLIIVKKPAKKRAPKPRVRKPAKPRLSSLDILRQMAASGGSLKLTKAQSGPLQRMGLISKFHDRWTLTGEGHTQSRLTGPLRKTTPPNRGAVRYRAILWLNDSSKTEVVRGAEWRSNRADALLDIKRSYTPGSHVVYEIEDSRGRRRDLNAREWESVLRYHWDSARTRG